MIKNLTGIRFYLFLFIWWSHMGNFVPFSYKEIIYPCMQTAAFSVTFFFMLSGFGLTLGYADKFSDNFYEYKNFIKKRFVKLYPLYFLTGLVFFNPLIWFAWLTGFIFLYVPMLQVYTTKYVFFANGAGWFVAALFFSYIVCPFLLFFLNKIKDVKIYYYLFAFPFIALFLIYGFLKIHSSETVYSFINHLPQTWFLVFLTGVLLGFIYKKSLCSKLEMLSIGYFQKSALDIVLIVFCLYGIFKCFNPQNFMTFIVITAIEIPLLVYLCIPKRSLFSDFLTGKFSLLLSSVSMECYLIHYFYAMKLPKILPFFCLNSLKGLAVSCLIVLILTIITSFIYNSLQKRVTDLICHKSR
ncbi:MAG: acyltransferase [Candidatus Gastranaerophilales bacterium]|nr:acyltransferase [Candidatus Gastranaerophilales bacterium]